MLTINIPGSHELALEGVVFDMNGTLTIDGTLAEGDRKLLELLAERLNVYVLTADTFGTAAITFADLPLELHRLEKQDGFLEKKAFIDSLGSLSHAAVGNGYNDHLMLRSAAIGVCVLGDEGAHPLSLSCADLVVSSTRDALELFLNPRRLIAGLRH